MSSGPPSADRVSSERFLVTGVLGCLGAWVARTLVRGGHRCGRFRCRPPIRGGCARFVTADELERVPPRAGRRHTGSRILARAFDEHEITNVVHLRRAADSVLPRGPRARRCGQRPRHGQRLRGREAAPRPDSGGPLVYASSAAYFGAEDGGQRGRTTRMRCVGPVHPLRRLQAGERGKRPHLLAGRASFSSLGLRPYNVYGPARDQGITASPTLAMRAAVRGEGYHINYGGRSPTTTPPTWRGR